MSESLSDWLKMLGFFPPISELARGATRGAGGWPEPAAAAAFAPGKLRPYTFPRIRLDIVSKKKNSEKEPGYLETWSKTVTTVQQYIRGDNSIH